MLKRYADNISPKRKNFVAIALNFVARNPSIAGGSTACAVAIGLISANALWYQPSSHPSPMFSTRDTLTNSNRPLPTKYLARPKAKEVSLLKKTHDVELVSEIQAALVGRGYYQSKVDGLFGSQTRSAIEKFQKSANITIDGEPSAKLLTRILLAPDAIPVPSLVASAIPTPAIPEADKQALGLVAEIQSGLRNYGYQDVVVDGLMGSQTMKAIRRFQLDYGMKITGEPSSTVLKKLKDIGAVGRG